MYKTVFDYLVSFGYNQTSAADYIKINMPHLEYEMSKLVEQIKRHEGFRSKPYKCTADKLSIGYGLNLDAGIDEELAEVILNHQLHKITYQLWSLDWFAELSNNRQDVIVNLVFNIGYNGMLKFKKMIAAIEVGDFDLAANEMLDSKWAKQVGNRAIELANQMRSGEYVVSN